MIRSIHAAPFVAAFTLAVCPLVSGLAVASAQDADTTEVGWPRQLGGDQYSVIMYQPEPESFEGDLLTGRAAVQVAARDGDTTPTFGAVWFEARVATDRDTRTSTIESLTIPEVRFPDATPEEEQDLADYMADQITSWDLTMSLDRLLATLNIDDSGFDTPDISVEAPEVIYMNEPAVLVQLDGDAIVQDIEGSDYQAVVNTAFTIIVDDGTYYLYAAQGAWYAAPAATGPFEPSRSVPSGVQRLVPPEADEDQPTDEDGVDRDDPPAIVVATEPTELLSVDGDPEFTPIADTDLLVVENTSADILLEIGTQRYYVLLSGRWYWGPSLDGPWTWVPGTDLPETFTSIPADSDMGSIRPHVAGTDEAREAVIDAQVPQTQTIERSSPSPDVEYDGDPIFEPVDSTTVEYAVNSPQQVIKAGEIYYLCDEGVWYTSSSPEGPWQVADSVPQEIYDIPASSPVHNVTYVYVYDSTPDVVYVGYTPGYTGTYVYGGTVVYGTGWYYQPWYGNYYYARPWSWGVSVRWNPWTGWSMGLTFSNGWFTFGIGGGWFRPWCCYGGWWGRAGYRHGFYAGRRAGFRAGYRAGYRAGNRASYRNNIYQRRDNVTRNAARPTQRPTREPRPANTPNNVFADRNGDVHRRNDNGSWQRRDGGGWGASTAQPSVRPGGEGRPTNRVSPSGDRAAPANRGTPSTGNRATPSTGNRATPSTGNRAAPSTGNRNTPSTSNRGSGYSNWGRSISGNSGASPSQMERDAQNRSRGNARANNYSRSRSGGARGGGRRR
jgi:hypothetical protein